MIIDKQYLHYSLGSSDALKLNLKTVYASTFFYSKPNTIMILCYNNIIITYCCAIQTLRGYVLYSIDPLEIVNVPMQKISII